jgi:hypothetical protein
MRRLLDQIEPHVAEPHRDRARAEVTTQGEHTLSEIRMGALQHDRAVVNAVIMRKRRSSRAQKERERDTERLVMWHLALRLETALPTARRGMLPLEARRPQPCLVQRSDQLPRLDKSVI